MNEPSDLIEDYLDESLTPADAEALRVWLASDRAHLQEFVLAVHQHRAMRAQLQAAEPLETGKSTALAAVNWFETLPEKSALGSTGYQPAWPKPLRLGEGQPVPSGNLPDGMGAASQNDSGAGLTATPSPVPVGRLPTGAGRLPAPPFFQAASKVLKSLWLRPAFHLPFRPWGACVVVAIAALVGFIVLLGASSSGLPTLRVSGALGNTVTIEPPPSLAARVSGSLNRTGVVLLQRLGRWVDRFAPKFGPGSVIRTGPGGFARLGYTNETTFVELRENSSLRIQSAKSGKRFELLVGTADIHAAPQAVGRPLQIGTPRAEIRVRGTKLSVAASAKSTRVKVTEGSVQLAPRARHPSAEVAAGQIAVAAAEAAVMTQTMRPITNHFGSGSILRELWLDVRGMKVQDLTASQNFLDRPNRRESLTVFETPMVGPGIDLYGARFRGYIHPPVTGQYTFWIAADDSAELWLSPDDRPDNKRRICRADEWSLYFRNWWHDSEQESATIILEAGRRYYIEALHKEGGGGDFLSVAWQPPGSDLEVIKGADLSPFQPAK